VTIKQLLADIDITEPETFKYFYPNIIGSEFEKLQAIQTLMHNSGFWQDLLYFNKIARALNGLSVNFSEIESLTVEQIWWAVEVANLIWPDKEYDWEVQKYVQFISNEDGVYIYPPNFDQLDNKFYNAAVKLINEKRSLTDNSVEEIQASKLLAIKLYIEKRKNLENLIK
jgi:hypothetical protein